jgi:hypothetical protein
MLEFISILLWLPLFFGSIMLTLFAFILSASPIILYVLGLLSIYVLLGGSLKDPRYEKSKNQNKKNF